jgi:quinol monooxygenase YgiN
MNRIVQLTFKHEHVVEFISFFEERKNVIRQVKGCTHLALWRDSTYENVFYTYSQWEHETDLDNYRQSLFFHETWSTIKQWFAAKPMAFSSEILTACP